MRRIVIGILTTMVLTACDQTDLCSLSKDYALDIDIRYNRIWQVTYPGAIDWERIWNDCNFDISYDSLMPDIPSGIRVVEYNDDKLIAIYNISNGGGNVNVSDDDNSLLMYNNDSEYIVYTDIDSISYASASTRTVQRSTYKGSPYVRNAVRLVNPPDMLYYMYFEDIDEFLKHGKLKVVMEPVVYTYLIRYKFDHGLDYVAIARGALAGMAEDVWLESGYAGDEAATILYDCQIKDWGVQAVVRSFGAPSLSPDQTYGLNLEVRLKNGQILDFNFDVTHQLEFQPKGGVIEVGEIDIPDDVGKEDPGTFDVTIEGWGEFEDIPVVF